MQIDSALAGTMTRLKGAPLSVIIVMILYPVALKLDDLTYATGYSKRQVRDTMRQLERDQLVINHGRYNGWVLSEQVKQLPLFHHTLGQPVDNLETSFLSAILGAAESAARRGEETHERQNLPLVRQNLPLTSHARVTTTSDTSLPNHSSLNSSSSNPNGLRAAIFSAAQQQPQIYELLLEGGVGAESPKMLELLQLHLDVDYLEPHVLQFLYEQERDGGRHTSGLLISRIERDHPPPPLRCRDHLDTLEPCIRCDIHRRMENQPENRR